MVGKDYKHANKYQTMSLDKRGVLTCWLFRLHSPGSIQKL